MPAYAFKGLDSGGKAISGVRDAESPRSLRSSLKRDGIFVTDVHEAQKKAQSKGEGLNREFDVGAIFDRIKPQDIAILTRQLATLLRAGIPLSEGLSALVEQATSDKLRRALADIRTQVNEGTGFGEALSAHPKVFSDLYVNLVRAGEAAGNLDHVLRSLADFLDNQIRLRSKIAGAMMYPIIMTVVGGLITALLMIVVVPQITQIFSEMGKALPWNTRMLIWMSEITGSYWWLLALLGGAAWWGFRRWRKSPKGKPKWDRFILKLWVVGPLVRMIAIARFARTSGTMLAGGVQLLKTLDIVKSVLGNAVLVGVIEDARAAIREGDSIADPLARSGEFPPIVTRMISVGERSGQLEGMLETVADAYETEVEIKLGRLTTILEPVMIVAMGVVVGFIVFSVLMPIMDMTEMVG